jgi:YegS/Rv2252/BmrU family lipid kinase
VETRLAIPESPEDARIEAQRSAEAGDRWLFAVGGDGSLRVAAAGLAGSETALAALPLGTVNVWARETGIPRKLRAALECHLDGQVTRIDLGHGAGHCFLLMASVGWDAAVARDVPDGLKRRIGDAAYVVQGARMLRQLHSQPVQWSIDGMASASKMAMLVVSNTRLYGGRVMFTPGAMADDGLFDYIALAPRRPGHTAALAARLVAKRLSGGEHVIEGHAREIAIETLGLAIQFDGDYIGETPVTLRVEPGALAVSLPSGGLPAFLSRRP